MSSTGSARADGVVALVAQRDEHRARRLEDERRAQPPVARRRAVVARRLGRPAPRRSARPARGRSFRDVSPFWQRYCVCPSPMLSCPVGTLPSAQIVSLRLNQAAAIPPMKITAETAASTISARLRICGLIAVLASGRAASTRTS